MKQILRRFSIYGDFWLRYLHWGTRHCPWFLEPVFILAFSIMFWLVLGRARRAVARNLAVLLPGSSPIVNQFRVIRVFWNFAWSMVDVGHVRHGEKCIRWEISGTEYLNALEKSDAGAILLTAHMGNYDVAAPLFAQKIHRPIHLVRTPERERESQEFEKENRDRQVCGNFVIHYNEPGSMLGVTLAQAISSGGIVAIQGDRILFDVSPMVVPFAEGVDWKLPRGPFMLALVARATIHPVFIIRMGWRRYRVQAEPAIELPMQDRDRERVQRDAALEWSAVLRRVAERHWRQWFVFEEVFVASGESSPARESQRVDAEGSTKGVRSPEESATQGKTVDREPVIESIIPGEWARGRLTVFAWNLVAGGWTLAVVLRQLLERSVGNWLQVAGALLAWPLIWFVVMVMTTQTALWAALIAVKLLRLPNRFYDGVACGIMSAIFGAVSWSEIQGGCPVGWWLGVIGFIGLAIGAISEAVLQLRGNATADLQPSL